MTTELSKTTSTSPITHNVSESFTDENITQFEQLVKTYALGVLRIRSGKSSGTGCLIGGNFLLTCFHVLKEKESLERTFAEVWYIKPTEDQDHAIIHSLTLKCIEIFCFSKNKIKKNGKPDYADKKHLDYAILRLKPHPYLSKIQDSCLNLFQELRDFSEKKVCLIHNPGGVNKEEKIQSQRSYGHGLINSEIDTERDVAVAHDAPGVIGSSGGPLITVSGNFIALHHQQDPPKKSKDHYDEYAISDNPIECKKKRDYRYAILTSVIVDDLDKEKGILELLKRQIEESKKELAEMKALKQRKAFVALLYGYYKTNSKNATILEEIDTTETIYIPIGIITEKERKEKKSELETNPHNINTFDNSLFKPKKKVKPEDLFTQKDLQSPSMKRVVLYGSAGAGKTTFVSHILRAWANKDLWHKFEAIISIQLNQLNNDRYPSKTDEYFPHHILKREHRKFDVDFEQLLKDKEFLGRCLLILDGYDELPAIATNKKARLYKAFEDLKALFPHILITTRHKTTVPNKTCEFEILGFDNKRIKKYVHAFYEKKDPQKAKRLLAYLKRVPLANNLSHIPLNLSIICSLFLENETLFNSDTPLTRTNLYYLITNNYYKKFLHRNVTSKSIVTDSKDLDLDPRVNQLLSCLGEIALFALNKGSSCTPSRKVTRTFALKNLTLGDNQNLGLLKIDFEQGSFIHLTFQDYFAAHYIAELYISEDLQNREKAQKTLKDNKFNPHFRLVWPMVAGCISLNELLGPLKSFFGDLFDKPKDLGIRNELNLIATCFEECPERSSIKQYSVFLDVCKKYVEKMFDSGAVVELLGNNTTLIHNNEITEIINKKLESDKPEQTLEIIKCIAGLKNWIPKEILVVTTKFLNKTLIDSPAGKLAITIFEKLAVNEQAFPDGVRDTLFRIYKDSFGFDTNSVKPALRELVRNKPPLTKEIFNRHIQILSDPLSSDSLKKHTAIALNMYADIWQALPKEVVDALVSFLKAPCLAPYDVKEHAALALQKVVKKGQILTEDELSALIMLLNDPQKDFFTKRFSANILKSIAVSGQFLPNNAIDALINSCVFPYSSPKNIRLIDYVFGKVSKIQDFSNKALDAFHEVLEYPHNYSFLEKFIGVTAALKKIEKSEDNHFRKTLIVIQCKRYFDTVAAAGNALRAIAMNGQVLPSIAINTLIDIFKNLDPNLHSNVMIVLGDLLGRISKTGQAFPDEVINIFVSALKNPNLNRTIIATFANTLGGISESGQALPIEAIDNMKEILIKTNPGYFTLQSGCSMLAKIAMNDQDLQEKAIDALMEILKVSRGKSCAIVALRDIAENGRALPNEVIDALMYYLENSSLFLTRYVVETLGTIVEKKHVFFDKILDRFIKLVNNPGTSGWIKGDIVDAIGEIAKTGQALSNDAINFLMRSLKDSDARSFEICYPLNALKMVAKNGQALPDEIFDVLLLKLFKNPEFEDEIIIRPLAIETSLSVLENSKTHCLTLKKEFIPILSFMTGWPLTPGKNDSNTTIEMGASSWTVHIDTTSNDTGGLYNNLLNWRKKMDRNETQ